ncbi:MAG: DUF488 family protein [Spirulinaceae cyanobacterium]
MSYSLYTVGHSNLEIEDFISLLQQHQITAVADVRSSPYSRRFPQFNQTAIQKSLKAIDISYVFLGQELGARTEDSNCYVEGKALYENIAKTELFSQGIQRIIKGLEHYKIALMCAEKDPITCHRTILVCRRLKEFDLDIHHILNDGSLESHQELEERLLQLFGLSSLQLQQPKVIQLSLFERTSNSMEIPPKSRAELLSEAYQKQGYKIAYVKRS